MCDTDMRPAQVESMFAAVLQRLLLLHECCCMEAATWKRLQECCLTAVVGEPPSTGVSYPHGAPNHSKLCADHLCRSHLHLAHFMLAQNAGGYGGHCFNQLAILPPQHCVRDCRGVLKRCLRGQVGVCRAVQIL